jgi:hypothetical protein
VLDKFVLASDVAHVVLEWQHVRTGQRIVVGKVSAWRDHVVSADPDQTSTQVCSRLCTSSSLAAIGSGAARRPLRLW